MATFRKIHTKFWGDPFMQELTPEQRYFYLFLLTNDKTKQCGIYEITKRQICYDTGYNIDTVSKLLQYFISSDKIRYNPETNELAIKNWRKYNESSSPKVQSCINQELSTIKDKTLIEYLYSMDTESQENKNKNKIQEENKIPFSNFVCYDAETYIFDNQISFEAICIATSKKPEEAKKELHKYHLWLAKKEKYPMGNKAVLAGFESWLLNAETYKKKYGLEYSKHKEPERLPDAIEAAKKYK